MNDHVNMDSQWREMVIVGQIVRTHGNKGGVIVDAATDFPEERFKCGQVLYLRSTFGMPKPFTIESCRFLKERPILKFESIGTIDDAEEIVNSQLCILENQLFDLPSNTHYQFELIGCSVETLDGNRLGIVSEVQGVECAQRLLVRGEDGHAKDIDVPLVESICVRVDTKEKVIVIDPPQGLLELNQV